MRSLVERLTCGFLVMGVATAELTEEMELALTRPAGAGLASAFKWNMFPVVWMEGGTPKGAYGR